LKRKHALVLGVALVTIVVLIISLTKIMSDAQVMLEQIATAEIQDVDLAKVTDGIYVGTYKIFPIDVKVEVTVADHLITQIDLLRHTNGQGVAAEIITDMVIDSQSLKVDVVSGATYSSKIILKAIENALANPTK